MTQTYQALQAKTSSANTNKSKFDFYIYLKNYLFLEEGQLAVCLSYSLF